jgi:hypothetical protein
VHILKIVFKKDFIDFYTHAEKSRQKSERFRNGSRFGVTPIIPALVGGAEAGES